MESAAQESGAEHTRQLGFDTASEFYGAYIEAKSAVLGSPHGRHWQ
jgi:hypothetical protein